MPKIRSEKRSMIGSTRSDRGARSSSKRAWAEPLEAVFCLVVVLGRRKEAVRVGMSDMSEETILFALLPLEQSQPLFWCVVSAKTEPEARRAASEQSPDHLEVDWLAPDKVECRRVVHMGGPAPPEGTVSYFYERADIVGG
jgi:hypothetical protein